jgi:hypothetical protein
MSICRLHTFFSKCEFLPVVIAWRNSHMLIRYWCSPVYFTQGRCHKKMKILRMSSCSWAYWDDMCLVMLSKLVLLFIPPFFVRFVLWSLPIHLQNLLVNALLILVRWKASFIIFICWLWPAAGSPKAHSPMTSQDCKIMSTRMFRVELFTEQRVATSCQKFSGLWS